MFYVYIVKGIYWLWSIIINEMKNIFWLVLDLEEKFKINNI